MVTFFFLVITSSQTEISQILWNWDLNMFVLLLVYICIGILCFVGDFSVKICTEITEGIFHWMNNEPNTRHYFSFRYGELRVKNGEWMNLRNKSILVSAWCCWTMNKRSRNSNHWVLDNTQWNAYPFWMLSIAFVFCMLIFHCSLFTDDPSPKHLKLSSLQLSWYFNIYMLFSDSTENI